jgi:microcystin-dependent protein
MTERVIITPFLAAASNHADVQVGEIFFDKTDNYTGYYKLSNAVIVPFNPAPQYYQDSNGAGWQDATQGGYHYDFNTKQLYVNNDVVWTAGNFNPANKANIDSPKFTGIPTVDPNQVISPSDNSTLIPTTAWVMARLSSTITPGMVMFYAGKTAPDGWLYCNGQAVNRATYAKLFALIGTMYGAGDGSTTFNLPDCRGQFIRCTVTGTNNNAVGPARNVGSWQDQAFYSHNHGGGTDAQGSHAHSAWTDGQNNHTHSGSAGGVGDHQHDSGFGENAASPFGVASGPNQWGTNKSDYDNYAFMTSWAGGHAHNVTIYGDGAHSHNLGQAASGQHNHVVYVAASGGSQNVPKNLAFPVMIKY